MLRPMRAAGIFVFLLLAAGLATWAGREPTTPAHPTWQPAGAQRAEVERVVDGDTLIAIVAGVRERIRLIGVDAPELPRAGRAGEPYAQQASDRLAAYVSGQIVWLVRDTSERDAYDRLLRYVHLEDGTCVNQQLALEGWVVVKSYPPDTARQAELEDAQRTAQKAKVGIWAP